MALNAVRETLEAAVEARAGGARARRARPRARRRAASTSRCRAGRRVPRGSPPPDHADPARGRGRLPRPRLRDRRRPRGRDRRVQLRRAQLPGGAPGAVAAATRSTSTTRHAPAHRDVAVADPHDGGAGSRRSTSSRSGASTAATRPTRRTRRSSTRSKGSPSTGASRSPTSRGRCCTSCARSSARTARVRFRTHYFPFTEPSMEADVSCCVCGGSGCPICKHSGWIEIGGSGMVDPKVLEIVGYDPERVARASRSGSGSSGSRCCATASPTCARSGRTTCAS